MSGVDRFNVLLRAVGGCQAQTVPPRSLVVRLCQATLASFLLGSVFEQMGLFTLKFSCGVGVGNDSEKVHVWSIGGYFLKR